jgi:flagellar M-ring protein FliF
MNLNLRQIASKLSPKGWAAVGGAALIGVLFVFVLFSMASSPSYTTVVAGVSPAQTGKITSALSTAGITYELQNNGTAVAVQTTQEAQARVVLDGQGLLVGTGTGSSYESLLGPQSLGASSQQQQEQATSALEQQLQQQIETMNGINTAQVVLGIPNQADNLFSAANTQPTGSVLLATTETAGGSEVRSIADMVANSVPGLSATKVTVSDQNGDLLWPNGSTNGNGTSAASKQAYQQSYDQAANAKVDAMLDSTIGMGKAYVQVNADLNTNQEQQASVVYGKTGTPLTQTKSAEKLTGTGTTPAAAGNTATQNAAPSYAGTAGGNSKYSNISSTTDYGTDKTVTHTNISPGSVNSQHIAVLVNSSVPKADVPAIQAAVEQSVGYVPKRDTIAVNTIPFAKQPTLPAPSSTKAAIGDVKYVAIGLAALLFLLFVTRMLRKRENEGFAGRPTWLRELENPRPLSALEAERQMYDLDQPTVVARLRPPVNLARQQVEELVDRDPERVASQIRQWMTED